MCRGRRAARRAGHNQQIAPVSTSPYGTSTIGQYGGYPTGPAFFSGRSCGRRRSNRQGPISGLISLAKPLIQGKNQSQPQNLPRAANLVSEYQPQMEQQSYGTVQAASVPRALALTATAAQKPEYEDEKKTPLVVTPRNSMILPTYEQAFQVQRAVVPEYDNVNAFSQLSLGQERQPQLLQQRQEMYLAEHVATQPILGSTQVDPRAMQPQISGRAAYKLQRVLCKAEEKLQKKADKYARKVAKAELKYQGY